MANHDGCPLAGSSATIASPPQGFPLIQVTDRTGRAGKESSTSLPTVFSPHNTSPWTHPTVLHRGDAIIHPNHLSNDRWLAPSPQSVASCLLPTKITPSTGLLEQNLASL
ncbi:hypothetical protein V2G26_009832 [Clonostachys chloroleuca]